MAVILLPSLAVFLQHGHGEYQAALIANLPYPGRLLLLEVNDCVIRPSGAKAASLPPVTSITEIDASIFLFILQPLESLNHRFLMEVVQTTLQPKCGVASGAEAFFAVKRELLAAAGGLPMVSTRSVRLRDAVTEQSRARGLQVLTPPHATATLSELATVK